MAKDSDTEVSIAVLLEKVKTLSEKVESLEKDRDSAIRWCITTLGAAVLGLGSWVFSLFETALKLE